MPELGQVQGGLLEVVAEDLVELDEALAVLGEPLREAAMQVGPRRLREPVVGGVADQEVPEAVRVLSRQDRPVRTHELAPDERCEPRRHLRLLRRQRLHRAAVEQLSLDGAALQDSALRIVELIEPRDQQRPQRCGDLDFPAIRIAECRHLGQKQRIATGGADDPLAHVVRDGGSDERAGLVVRQRLQTQHRRPAGTTVEQLGPRHADEQRAARP